MLAITLTFAGWWIPLVVTLFCLFAAIRLLYFDRGSVYNVMPLFFAMLCTFPALIAWLIYFAVLVYQK